MRTGLALARHCPRGILQGRQKHSALPLRKRPPPLGVADPLFVPFIEHCCLQKILGVPSRKLAERITAATAEPRGLIRRMSAIGGKADTMWACRNVRFWPKADKILVKRAVPALVTGPLVSMLANIPING